jgi:hypothetical protein
MDKIARESSAAIAAAISHKTGRNSQGGQVAVEAFRILTALRARVDAATAGYVHSTPLVSYKVAGRLVEFDFRDLLLMGAVTESDVLLTGKTGAGKTSLGHGVMTALFGEGNYFAKTTLPTMNVSEFMDIDFKAILQGEKTLREAVSGLAALKNWKLVETRDTPQYFRN